MKFDSETFITVLIALVVFKVLDKLFLDNLVSKIGSFEISE